MAKITRKERVLLEKIELNRAKRVVDLYPTFHELMKDKHLEKVLHPIQRVAFMNSQEWEGVAMALNNMMLGVFDIGWYNDYSITKKGNGSATVLDSQSREYEVNGYTFWAMTKMVFCEYLEYDLSDEALRASQDFKWHNKDVSRILD